MKGFGRAFELNCLFLVVVALLVALQLVLQRSHRKELLVQLKERGEGGEEEGQQHQDPLPIPAPLHLSAPDSPLPDAKALGREEGGGGGEGGGDKTLAAPLVPNIRRSFPKRKAPYVRKAKKNKKKKKNRKGNQQQQQQKEIRGGENVGKGVDGRNSHWGGKGVNSVHEKGEQKGNKQKRGKAGDKAKG